MISVVVPSYNRQQYFPLIHNCFLNQDYENKEMLVFDDSASPSIFFRNIKNVRYFYSSKRLSIGHKRNLLIKEAKGTVISHFDDDDYYAPHYLSSMLDFLQGNDLVHLTAWFCYSVHQQALGYWNTKEQSAVNYLMQSNKPLALVKGFPPNDAFINGYGFSYFYKKALWQKTNFPNKNHGEDYEWFLALKDNSIVKAIEDEFCLALHVIHKSNTSRCFPNYNMPNMLVDKLFGEAVNDYIKF